MPNATLYVTASGDDAEEEGGGDVALAGTEIGATANFIPAAIYRTVPIPPGATVSTALFLAVPVNSSSATPNLTIRGEIAPADFEETASNLTDRAKTSTGVVWDEADVWGGAGIYATSPNIASVIQEIIDYGDWAEDEDLALFLLDRGLGGVFYCYAYDEGPNTYPPALFLEWTVPVVTGELDYGWPGDYWPDEYFAEYWPDYGTATPPSSIGPVAFMHLQRMHRRSSL